MVENGKRFITIFGEGWSSFCYIMVPKQDIRSETESVTTAWAQLTQPKTSNSHKSQGEGLHDS